MTHWLQAYDLAPPLRLVELAHQGLNNGNIGIESGAGSFVARVYADEDVASIAYEHRLLAWLAAQGLSFAVPAPVAARDGSLLQRGPRGGCSLSPRLPGTPLDLRHPDHVELLGAATGELQAALRRHPPVARPGRALFTDLFQFPPPSRDPFTLTPAHVGLARTAQAEALFQWWRDEAAQLQCFIDGPFRALPRHICHNDITPGNVLALHGRATAVLDFEFATQAPRALDVAMALRMAMRTWENSEPWAAVRRLRRGYARWGRLTEEEVRALPWLIRLRGAITVLWWLGRNDPQGDPGIVPSRMEYARRMSVWLQCHAARLCDTVAEENA